MLKKRMLFQNKNCKFATKLANYEKVFNIKY